MNEQKDWRKFVCDTCEDIGEVTLEGQIGAPGAGCRITCPDCGPTPPVMAER